MSADEAAATVREALDQGYAGLLPLGNHRAVARALGVLVAAAERADRLEGALAAQMALTAAAYCDPDHLAHKDYIDGMDAARAALEHGGAT